MQAKDDEVYELKQALEDLQDDIATFEKKERELLSYSSYPITTTYYTA